MKRQRQTILLVCVILWATLWPVPDHSSTVAQELETGYAFVDVHVVTMTQATVRRHQTVLVTGDRIVAIGAVDRVEPRAGMTVIPGNGRYLMPGLVDAHVHLVSDYDLSVLLAYGVTTVRNMNGRPEHLRWRDEVARGARPGPQIITASPMLGEVPADLRDGPNAMPIAARVAEYAARGYDFIKVGDALTTAELADTAAAAHQVGLDIVGHTPDCMTVADLLDYGLRSSEHLDGLLGLSEEQLQDLLPEMAQRSLWVVPTLTIWQHYRPVEGGHCPAQQALIEYVTRTGRTSRCLAPSALDRPHALSQPSAHAVAVVRTLHDAGVPLMLGTDAPFLCTTPGESVLQELRNLVDAGLTPYEALRTATVNPAEFLRQAEAFGTVELGKRADLLLLQANPLEDVAAVRGVSGVMVRGTWLTDEQLDSLRNP